MARGDRDRGGRLEGPIICCCNQSPALAISPPPGPHLTRKEQVINSGCPGWSCSWWCLCSGEQRGLFSTSVATSAGHPERDMRPGLAGSTGRDKDKEKVAAPRGHGV